MIPNHDVRPNQNIFLQDNTFPYPNNIVTSNMNIVTNPKHKIFQVRMGWMDIDLRTPSNCNIISN